MNETPIEAGNDVGRFLQGEMNRRGWSLRDVEYHARRGLKKPFSYEHIRKIIKGNAHPSTDMLEKVAKVFGIETRVLMEMYHKSTITRKFGRDYLDTLDITPEMYEIDSLMKGLLPHQREMVIVQIKALVRGNIASGKMATPAVQSKSSIRKVTRKGA